MCRVPAITLMNKVALRIGDLMLKQIVMAVLSILASPLLSRSQKFLKRCGQISQLSLVTVFRKEETIWVPTIRAWEQARRIESTTCCCLEYLIITRKEWYSNNKHRSKWRILSSICSNRSILDLTLIGKKSPKRKPFEILTKKMLLVQTLISIITTRRPISPNKIFSTILFRPKRSLNYSIKNERISSKLKNY